MMNMILRGHDALTRTTFWIAMAAVFYLTAVIAYEVVSRYLFRAPTDWAPDTSAVAFAFITFLAVPELTRHSGHAAMIFVVAHARPAVAVQLTRLSLAAAFAACAICAWFGTIEAARQVGQGVTMIAVLPIPKWIVTIAIVYGLTSAALYFLRQFCATWAKATREGSAWNGTYS